MAESGSQRCRVGGLLTDRPTVATPAFQRQERTASVNAFALGSPAIPFPIWFMT